MSVGTANGIPFTASDLDAIVASFEALGLSRRVPLKFGHNDDQPMTDGQPALGWVSRVWREGDKLLADLVDIPNVVFDAIKNNLYRFVSVELLKNVQAGTRSIPWVLDAVALLGADQPAFGNLKDLQALTLKRGPVLRASARVAFTRDRKLFTTGAKQAMNEEEVKALLKKQADELKAQFKSDMDAAIAKIKADAEAALQAEKEARKQDQIKFHREAVKAKFETAVKDGVLLPAKREQFYKFAKVDTDAVSDIKLEDVDAYIKDNAEKVTMRQKPTSAAGLDADPSEAGKPAAEVVVMRARKLCFARNQDPANFAHYNAAVVEVLGTDKELGEAYKQLGEYKPAAA